MRQRSMQYCSEREPARSLNLDAFHPGVNLSCYGRADDIACSARATAESGVAALERAKLSNRHDCAIAMEGDEIAPAML